LFGYPIAEVIPTVLLSQAIGGVVGSIFHHKCGNIDIKDRRSKIIISVIGGFGVIATIIGVVVAVKIPAFYVKSYIAILIIAVGLALIHENNFIFKWWKIAILGILASFNKGISGGGFGPLVTGGQIISGNGSKQSISCTTASEVPICLIGFLTFILVNKCPDFKLLIPICIGAAIGGLFGPYFTKVSSDMVLKKIIGLIILAEGIVILMTLK
jgi:uncharacterized membrane protein YfcA